LTGKPGPDRGHARPIGGGRRGPDLELVGVRVPDIDAAGLGAGDAGAGTGDLGEHVRQVETGGGRLPDPQQRRLLARVPAGGFEQARVLDGEGGLGGDVHPDPGRVRPEGARPPREEVERPDRFSAGAQRDHQHADDAVGRQAAALGCPEDGRVDRQAQRVLARPDQAVDRPVGGDQPRAGYPQRAPSSGPVRNRLLRRDLDLVGLLAPEVDRAALHPGDAERGAGDLGQDGA
jgi:hypothetical protein